MILMMVGFLVSKS